ncbi:hypothetical protein DMC25_06940 [Caulobacter sp. D4A]|uniref:hypothetical protein n=1 Tax=unclassified Caulobacter TaxID=2648921 RepID=UPI000D732B00|nr:MULTISPECIES: hypothetical protein [unclassified Caulobacter]PXA90774.1 hypothetical protein DMC25_06940 [Caulobacter sp. D4A]PXA94236.1 hypothetical protein DMC18_06775 [Caulobacter sp. D5]
MPLVIMNTPQGPVAVNSADVFCIVPEPQTPAADCEIRYDAPRSVLALHTADEAAARLDADLRRLAAASLDFDHVWINPARVTSVVPHPQVANVCFVVSAARKIAVKGELEAVVAALG